MLPKKQRLTTEEFKEVFSTGRKYHTPFFTYIVLKKEDKKTSVVVSKKNIKTAVGRNKKRRMIYRILQSLQSISPSFWNIMIIKKEALEKDTNEIQKDIEGFYKKYSTE
ncbi:MAG: ribonuclease P protein component [Flavobacteriaceae bacterium]|jgi:ribonuclease P protein component